MSKGRFEKSRKKVVPVWLILLVLVILAITAVICFGGNSEQNPSETQNDPSVQTEDLAHAGSQDPQAESNVPGEDDGEGPEENTAESTQSSNENDHQNNGQDSTKPTQSDGKTEGGKDQDATQTPDDPQEEQTQPTIVLIQRADADYEQWLSAALVICVSMEYPDFELEGVYAASATTLEDKFSSQGAYIVFTSGGQRMAIHAKALEAERTAAGTVDISTEAIGYATFDKVDPASINFSAMDQIALDDLSELIAQSVLVSIYKH